MPPIRRYLRLRPLIALPVVPAAVAFFGTARTSAQAEVAPPGTERPAGQEQLFVPDPLHALPEVDLGVLRQEEAPTPRHPRNPKPSAR